MIPVKRGRLINYRTGVFVEFLFNPEQVDYSKGSNLVIEALPGQSDPWVGWASGKARSTKFTLKLDGEQSVRRRGLNMLNGVAVNEHRIGTDGDVFSVAGEIEFFEQFLYPVDPGDSPGASPDKVVFSMGRLFPGVVCFLQDLEVKVTKFTPTLDPSAATLSFTLTRVQDKQIYSNKVWGSL